MTDRCPRLEDVAVLLELPDDDPRREHLADCPDCHAVALAFDEFMDPTPLHSEQDVREADRELAERLQEVIPSPGPLGTVSGSGASGAGAGSSGTSPVRGGGTSGPFRRALMALAAVLAIAAIVIVVRDITPLPGERLPEGPGTIRETDIPEAAPVWQRDETGSRLTWQPLAGSAGVVVVLFDAAMAEIGRFPAHDAGSLTLGAGAVPAEAAYAQILFVAQGDTVARSPIVAPR
ncbi:MAG: hypothetical protein JRF70_16400 [Deltaproteobacteria bacterium]|nr:hypothetical protein [Deltaproteobacteria bacterium]